MTRLTAVLAVVVMAGVAAAPLTALANPPLERGTGPGDARQELHAPWTIKTFQTEITVAVQKAVSAVEACARTVATVVKALVRALHTVLMTMVRVIIHLAGTLAMAVAKWLLALVLG